MSREINPDIVKTSKPFICNGCGGNLFKIMIGKDVSSFIMTCPNCKQGLYIKFEGNAYYAPITMLGEFEEDKVE